MCRELAKIVNSKKRDHNCTTTPIATVDPDSNKKARRGYDRRGRYVVLKENIKERAKKYYRAYRKLSEKERCKRVRNLSDEILAACINKEIVTDNIVLNMQEDHELLVDLATVLDLIKLRLESLLKKRFAEVETEMTEPPPRKENEDIIKFSQTFAPTSTRSGYNRMREQYTTSQDIP